MKKYNILITNDDGLFSYGLIPLIKEIEKIGNICVIVPEKEMSAISHSLSLYMPVRVRDVKLNGYNIKLVSGTPADCVRLGIIEFQKLKTDIVISGINQGPNLGQDVNYSGTVAAAREAVFLNTTGIAVSALGNNYDLVSKFVRMIVEYIMKNSTPHKKYFLNINFPKGKPKGIKITSLGERRYEDVVHKKKDPIGLPYYWLKSKLVKNSSKKKPSSDVSAVEDGYISITPLTFDITNYVEIKMLGDFFKDFKI
ncbi:MAG: 5'/3'-nucleotidase SurE [Endomicrobia bacterium]|nr:5'/3'-nucleotidase SurE [Endomicrobiia bacterium]